MFGIPVKRPRSTAARRWIVAQDVLYPVIVVTPIVLKLTGVISWSWWWVLSPIWISGLLGVLGLLVVWALLAGVRRHQRRQARMWMNELGPEWFRQFLTGKADPRASRGDPGAGGH